MEVCACGHPADEHEAIEVARYGDAQPTIVARGRCEAEGCKCLWYR